jgi:hypothetical protein
MRVRAGVAALLLLAHAAAADPARPKSIDPLTLFYQARVQGGLAVAATCVNFNDPADGGPNGGSLDLAGMPPGAEVQAAFLYWSVLSMASPVPAGSPTLDGTPLTIVRLGEIMDTPCYSPHGQAWTGIFRADVTPLIAGNGAYQLAGLVGTGAADADLTEGATLFVAYCAAGSPETDIVLFDGIDVVTQATRTFSQTISSFEAAPTEPVSATLAMAVGNGQDNGRGLPDDDIDPLYFDDIDLDARDRSLLSGALCPDPDPLTGNSLYDRTVVDVTGLVPAGSTTAMVRIEVVGDCYDIGAVALAVATVPGSVLREPSALDRQPAATPLRVAKAGADYAVTWEDVGAPTYDLYRGAIGAWYSHGETGACALASPSVTLPLPPGNVYLLAASVGCGGPSSLGRDSFGRERPSALAASGRPCP